MALDFDGSGDILTAPTSMSQPLTLAAWFNLDSFTTTPDLVVINKDDLTDAWRMGVLTTGEIKASSRDTAGTESRADSTATASTGTWAHGCGVFISSTSRAAYLNGGNKGTNATSRVVLTCTQICIGGFRSAGSNFNLANGRIAEAAGWSVALDDQEIAALGKGYSPLLIRKSALKFYIPLVRNVVELKGSAITTIGAPSVSNHCGMIYPRRSRTWDYPTAAAGSGMGALLSNRRSYLINGGLAA